MKVRQMLTTILIWCHCIHPGWDASCFEVPIFVFLEQSHPSIKYGRTLKGASSYGHWVKKTLDTLPLRG
jgi:hypothetical protein